MPIVLSTNIVLTEEEQDLARNPVIGWHDLVEVGNVDATTEDADFPASNVANPLTHLYWKAGVNTGDEYLTVTTNYLEPIDYLGVARHNFGSANIVTSVEGCEDLSDSPQVWVEIVQEQQLADDTPVLFQWEPAAYQGVRLRMQPGDEVAEAGVVYVGKLLIMERSIKLDPDHTPINLGRVTRTVSGKSTNGNFLGRIVLGETRESTAEFEWITPTWYRDNFDEFVIASQAAPFFFAWNPVEYPADVGFCWLVNDPVPEVDPVTRRFAVQLKMQGVA